MTVKEEDREMALSHQAIADKKELRTPSLAPRGSAVGSPRPRHVWQPLTDDRDLPSLARSPNEFLRIKIDNAVKWITDGRRRGAIPLGPVRSLPPPRRRRCPRLARRHEQVVLHEEIRLLTN